MSNLNSIALQSVFERFNHSETERLDEFSKEYQGVLAIKNDYVRLAKGVVRDHVAMEVAESALNTPKPDSELQEISEERKSIISSTVKGKKNSAFTGMRKLIVARHTYTKLLEELRMKYSGSLSEDDIIRLEIPQDLDIEGMSYNSGTILKKK